MVFGRVKRVEDPLLLGGGESGAVVANHGAQSRDAGDRGIRQVEVSTDAGMSWDVASLIEPAPGKDAMVRWEATFEMVDTPVTLVVRATDGAGEVQSDDFGLPAPDGGWGQDSIQVQPA